MIIRHQARGGGHAGFPGHFRTPGRIAPGKTGQTAQRILPVRGDQPNPGCAAGIRVAHAAGEFTQETGGAAGRLAGLIRAGIGKHLDKPVPCPDADHPQTQTAGQRHVIAKRAQAFWFRNSDIDRVGHGLTRDRLVEQRQ